jgi:sirohydrochlorin cobaltochelatase
MDSAIVLAMHGAPPRDFAADELNEFYGLHARAEVAAGRLPPAVAERYHALEARIRTWPRTEANDPFWAGSMALAKALQQASGQPVEVGFNEFCSPALGEAMDAAVASGAKRLRVVTPMMTHGGDHAEVDIPRSIAEARLRHPGVAFDYVWPFPLEDIARFLVRQLERHPREGDAPTTAPSEGA